MRPNAESVHIASLVKLAEHCKHFLSVLGFMTYYGASQINERAKKSALDFLREAKRQLFFTKTSRQCKILDKAKQLINQGKPVSNSVDTQFSLRPDRAIIYPV